MWWWFPWRDLADVQDLITRLELPLAFANRLHPWVRAAYRDLWEKAQAIGSAGPHEE